jgi:predicted nucleic-acid-binding protein
LRCDFGRIGEDGLELEWVLRAFYRFEPAQIVRVLEHLLGLGHVNTEEAERIATALQSSAEGMDFADALHLAGGHHCEALYIFDDRRFARRARGGSAVHRPCRCRPRRHEPRPTHPEHDRQDL